LTLLECPNSVKGIGSLRERERAKGRKRKNESQIPPDKSMESKKRRGGDRSPHRQELHIWSEQESRREKGEKKELGNGLTSVKAALRGRTVRAAFLTVMLIADMAAAGGDCGLKERKKERKKERRSEREK